MKYRQQWIIELDAMRRKLMGVLPQTAEQNVRFAAIEAQLDALINLSVNVDPAFEERFWKLACHHLKGNFEKSFEQYGRREGKKE